MRLRNVLPLTLCAAAVVTLSACSSSSTPTETQPAAENKDFMDQHTQEFLKQVPESYKTPYFALGIPEGWKVVTFKDQPLDSSISVQSLDRSVTLTIRVRSSEHNIEEACALAKDAFVANGAKFTNEPSVQFGTCIVEADENGKPSTLWMRNYDDDKSSYSIAISGPLDKASEILTYLVGNEKMMGLMVRPL